MNIFRYESKVINMPNWMTNFMLHSSTITMHDQEILKFNTIYQKHLLTAILMSLCHFLFLAVILNKQVINLVMASTTTIQIGFFEQCYN